MIEVDVLQRRPLSDRNGRHELVTVLLMTSQN